MADLYSKMIQKAVPDFDSARDYVLWLVFDFWSKSYLYDVSGQITLYDNQDQELSLADVSVLPDVKPIIRTPYPNHCEIRQVGMQCGRKRLFGFPIVIRDVLSFNKIKKIRVHWELINPMYLDDKTLMDLRLVSVDAVYLVSFDLQPGKHWFTLNREIHRFNWESDLCSDSKLQQYYDFGLCSFDEFVTTDNKSYRVDYGDTDVYVLDGSAHSFTEKEKSVLAEFEAMSFDNLLQMARACEVKHPVGIKGEYSADRYYYEQKVQLVSDSVPDIAALATYGFK